MKVLLGERWRDGFLDYHRSPECYRVRVLAWQPVERIEGLYFVRSAEVRMLRNYLREVGFSEVVRKVRSRYSERFRNEKWLSLGVGRVIERSAEGQFAADQLVGFLAPKHPRCTERLVCPEELMVALDDHRLPTLSGDRILFVPEAPIRGATPFDIIKGWDAFSGETLDAELVEDCRRDTARWLYQIDWNRAIGLPIVPAAPVIGRTDAERPRRRIRTRRGKRAALFGYGNYAKTVIIPNLGTHLAIDQIHEVDPTQIPPRGRLQVTWDTSPSIRSGDAHHAYAVAGFHHTHTDLALAALERGAYAVVEKPLAVSARQLSALLDGLRNSAGQLFACFHRRYMACNQWLAEDLGLDHGTPVSYHCIVYEVPLPTRHWYRWPNSRSRLVSNGCHWVDHFLYLNGFAEPRKVDVWAAADGTINCSAELANGAAFTMALTDRGGDRIGLQDYVEVRTNERSARIVNGSSYVAEDSMRIVREERFNKFDSYKRMYRAIGRRINAGEAGDSERSVSISSRLVLDLEDRYKKTLPDLSSGRS